MIKINFAILIVRNNLSKGTQKSYRIGLRYYRQLLNKTVTDLIEEAEKEEIGGILPKKRKFTNIFYKQKISRRKRNGPINIKSLFLCHKIFIQPHNHNSA